MRRCEKEIVDRTEIDAILNRAQVCRIALCDENTPYVVPMSFGYDGCFLYLHCALEGRKLEILGKNPRVCFEVDIDQAIVVGETACSYSFNYHSVIGVGSAVLIDDPTEKRAALDTIIAHYAPHDTSYPDAAVAEVTVIKIQIESITGKKSG